MLKKQVLITIGNFVYLFAQWAMTIVVVKLSDEYYLAGLLGLAMTIANIFYIIASYGLRSYQVSDINHEYLDQTYTLSRLMTIPLALILCAIYTQAIGYAGEYLIVILLFMTYKCLEAGSDVLYGIMQKCEKYNKICVSMSLKGIFTIILFSIILSLDFSISVALIFINIVAIFFIFLDVFWCIPLTERLINFHGENIYKAVKLLFNSFPMVLLTIASPLLMSIPRIYFEKHYSTEMLGVYSSLSAPTLAITTIVSCAVMPYIPLFAKYYKENNKRQLIKLIFSILIFTINFGMVAVLICRLIGEWVIQLLYDSSICKYNNVFQLLILVSTLSSINMFLIVVFTSIRKLFVETIILFSGCVLCYIITPFLVDGYGMSGVTFSLIISQTIQIIISLVVLIKCVKKTKDV